MYIQSLKRHSTGTGTGQVGQFSWCLCTILVIPANGHNLQFIYPLESLKMSIGD